MRLGTRDISFKSSRDNVFADIGVNNVHIGNLKTNGTLASLRIAGFVLT